jgi:hypothetical protein
MTRGDLRAILDAGDIEACLAYFHDATEDERKAVATLALEWYEAQQAAEKIAGSPRVWGSNPLLAAARLAVCASCSLSQIKKRGLNLTNGDVDLRMLQSRKPDWITEYAAWSLAWIPTEPFQANDLVSLVAFFPGSAPSRS